MTENINTTKQNESILLRYAVAIPLPDPVINRPIEDLKTHPHLLDIIKKLVDTLEKQNYAVCKGEFAVGFDEISAKHIEIHYENRSDKDNFLVNWPYDYKKIKVKRPKYAVSWLDAVES